MVAGRPRFARHVRRNHVVAGAEVVLGAERAVEWGCVWLRDKHDVAKRLRAIAVINQRRVSNRSAHLAVVGEQLLPAARLRPQVW